MAEGEGNDGTPHKQVRTLQGLLNFCTEVTAREDRTQDSSMVEITQERRQFLEDVFHGLQGGAAKYMAECLQKLTEDCVNNMDDDISEQEAALDEIAEFAEDINYAIDLDRMNGFPIFVKILNCPHPSLQKRAAQVIGDICQNNDIGQRNMLQLNTMQMLLNILDTHNDWDCKIKALFALSCLTRDFEPAEKQFVELSGFCYLMRAIQTKIPKLVIKSIFLLNYFIQKTDKYKDTLVAMGFIEQLVSVLSSEDVDDTSREFCTLSLLNLSTSYDKALHECLRPEFQLVPQLQERKKFIAGKEEFQDEDTHITALLKVFEENEEVDEGILR